jgi:antitoxin PrlF
MTKLVTLTSQGRVTLPKELRASLGLKSGAKLMFSQLADGTVIMRVKHQKLSDLAGILTRQNQPSVAIADMKR